MKLKHVKKILIGATGVFAVGGMVVNGNHGLHIQDAKEAAAETGTVEEEENLSSGLFAGVKLIEAEMAADSGLSDAAAEIEELHLAKTTQSLEEQEMPENETDAIEQTAEQEVSIETETQPESAGVSKNETKEKAAVSIEETKTEEKAAVSIEETETEEKAAVSVEETGKKEKDVSDGGQETTEADVLEGENVPKETEVSEEEIEITEEPEEAEEPELVIATVDNYLNIRSEANLEGEVIGKLYNHSVGELTEEVEDGWYRIESGSVDGYVKAEYVLRGEEGKELADEVGQRLAEVNTTTLRVRMEPTTESEIVGLVPDGGIYEVSEEVEGWAKILFEGGEGYVSTDYAEVYTENTVAESKEEEEARLWKEAEERRIAEEAAAQEWARQQAAASSNSSQGSSQSSSSSAPSSSSGGSSQASGSGLGSQIANFALQFVGNPYVYGGTSLTNGADCSGFVMSVFQNFGISLPRTSGEQGQCGWDVGGLGNAKAGDLVSYSGHIGIYIGNGQIVHASTPSSGIKVSNANYRSILSVRRIV